VVAHEKPINRTSHYTVNPNNIVALSNTSINVKQKNLGILVVDETSCKFYFAESNLGRSRSAHGKEYVEQTQKYLLNFYTRSIVLNDVLVAAGAEIVDSIADADIDLSLENVNKMSILDLLKG
jgi:lipopolysaccharide assembly outer membrane protein LptD (OstA)